MKPNTSPHGHLANRFPGLSASILGLAFLAPAASIAATIYSEPLGTGSGNANFASVGWSAYVDSIHNTPASGTFNTTIDISTQTPTSLAYINATSSLIASSSTNFSTHVALITDAGSIDPTDYQSDLTISFDENATDDGLASPEMGWRALAQVGSTIYVSDFFAFSSTLTTRNVVVSDSVWHVWTGETNLSNGFNIATISGTATTLAPGTISGIGVLAIDGGQSNDRMRLDNFLITGTAVPEPSAALLGSIGLLALLRRRRA